MCKGLSYTHNSGLWNNWCVQVFFMEVLHLISEQGVLELEYYHFSTPSNITKREETGHY